MDFGVGFDGGRKEFGGGDADPVSCFQSCNMGGERTGVEDLQHIGWRGERDGKRAVLSRSAQPSERSTVEQGPQQASVERPWEDRNLISPVPFPQTTENTPGKMVIDDQHNDRP